MRRVILAIIILSIVMISGCIGGNGEKNTTTTLHKIVILSTTEQTTTTTSKTPELNITPGQYFARAGETYMLPYNVYSTVITLYSQYLSVTPDSAIYSTASEASFWINAVSCPEFNNANAFLNDCGNIVNFAALYNMGTYPVTFMLIGNLFTIKHVAIVKYNKVYDPYGPIPIDYYTQSMAPKYGNIIYYVTIVKPYTIRVQTAPITTTPPRRNVEVTLNGTTYFLESGIMTMIEPPMTTILAGTIALTIYPTTNGDSTVYTTITNSFDRLYCTLVPPVNTFVSPLYPVNYLFTNCTFQLIQPTSNTISNGKTIAYYSNGVTITYW